MGMLGEMIRIERRKKGGTQQELADRSGIPVTSIRRYEIGQRVPRSANLNAIAEALDVGIDKFIGKDAAVNLDYINVLKGLIEDASLPEGTKDLLRAMLEANKEEFYKKSDKHIDDEMKKEIDRVYDSFNLSGREKIMAYIQFLDMDPENKKK